MKLGPLVLALLCGTSAGALAESARERIGSDRAAANAKLAERQRECATHFVVAACLDDARTEHREALKRLRQEELQLDEAKRRAAAEGRRKAIAEKARASEAAPDAPKVRMRRAAPAASEPASRPTGNSAPRVPQPAMSSASRSATERREQQKFEARQREAQAHREAAAERNAARAARGKTAAPLPVPSAPR